MKEKLFPIVCCVLIFVWASWFVLYATSEPANTITTTYSIEQQEDEVKEVASTLLELKWQKQLCKDNLTEYQTLAEYKWIQYYCSDNDAEIERLKIRLAAILTMQYEQLDANLNESKQEQQMNMLANGTWSAIEKLTAFLQSE